MLLAENRFSFQASFERSNTKESNVVTLIVHGSMSEQSSLSFLKQITEYEIFRGPY
jgi:hypothetical protein